MSTTIPPQALRRAIVATVGERNGAALFDDAELIRIVEHLQQMGYVIVSRRDMHALRAASDRVLRYTPEAP